MKKITTTWFEPTIDGCPHDSGTYIVLLDNGLIGRISYSKVHGEFNCLDRDTPEEALAMKIHKWRVVAWAKPKDLISAFE